MGTRGLFGFYYKGKYYIIYNHFDSYPDGLGQNLVDEIKAAMANGTFDSWIPKLLSLIIIADERTSPPPTDEDVKRLAQFTNLDVSSQSSRDWYCLLRKCQGSFERVLNSGYLLNQVDADGKPNLSECDGEYMYILNFDDNTFDVSADPGSGISLNDLI